MSHATVIAEIDTRKVVCPVIGDRVEIVKGRRNQIGIQGILFWCRTDLYGYYNSGVNPRREVVRVGVRQNNGEVVWDYITNLSKI